MSSTPKSILKFRIFLFNLLILVALFLTYKAVVPFGEITYTWKPCKDTLFISKLKPKDRIEGNCLQKIVGEPAYFNLKTPRTFDTAKVTLRYKRNPISTEEIGFLSIPIVELGAQADKQKNYRLKPVENKIIDSLDWGKIEDGGVILLQRNLQFDSVDKFLNNLPPKDEIALYNYDLPIEKKINNYVKSGSGTAIKKPLRGPYRFYTYLGEGEDLDFEFEFYDINQNKDADPIEINLYYDNKIIKTEKLDDDGISEDVRQRTEPRSLNLRITGAEVGFYKVEVKVNDDIITDNITTKQKILSFINRVWLAEAGNTDLINVRTDSSGISIQTINAASLQKILVGDEILNVEETYKQFSQTTDGEITKIQFAKDDIILAGDGVFSFSAESLYNPSYQKINRYTEVDKNGINYILANYQKPKVENGWQVQTIEFNLKNAYREDGQCSFMISVPGLIADPPSPEDSGEAKDGVANWIEVGEIKVELEGRTLWEKLREFLNQKNG